jgi:hypothetical protein
MATSRVYEQEVDGTGVVFGYVETTVGFADFEAEATSDTVSMVGFPANAFPLRGELNPGDYFTDSPTGTISAATLEMGDTNDPNGIVTALNVFDTVTEGAWQGTAGVEAEYGSTGCVFEAAYAPILTLRLTSENCDTLTTGHATARLYYKRYASK